MIKMIRRWWMCALLPIAACNTQDITIDQTGAEWALPLIQGQIKPSELILKVATEAQLLIQADGTLIIRYTGDVLQKTKKEIFTPLPGSFPIPMIDTNNQITLPVVNNVIIKKATLTNGNYFFNYAHNRQEAIRLELFVPEMKLNTNILRHLIDVPYLGTPVVGNTSKFSFNDIIMIPVNNKISLNYKARTLSGEAFKMSSVFFIFDQIDFSYIEGFFGQNTYDLKKDSLEIDLYDGFVQGGIYIDDPRIILSVTSSFGFPTKAVINTFDLQTKDNNIIPFKSKLLDEGLFFNYPKINEIGQSKTTTFVFNKDNSNVRDVFNAQAKRVIYDIDALSNPLLIADSTHFVTEDGKFTIAVTVDLPLRGRITQYPATQIFEADASKLSSLESGFLLLETTNGMPITANAQFYLYNGSGALIDSIFVTPQVIFKAAPTDANGVATVAAFNTLKIPVPGPKINAWSATRQIRVETVFNTPADKNIIQISNKDILTLRMGFVGKFKS